MFSVAIEVNMSKPSLRSYSYYKRNSTAHTLVELSQAQLVLKNGFFSKSAAPLSRCGWSGSYPAVPVKGRGGRHDWLGTAMILFLCNNSIVWKHVYAESKI